MKKSIRLYFLMFIGFATLLSLSSCDPEAGGRDTDDGVFMLDGSGNSYSTVVVGRLTITTENLKTKKYNDGTDIPFVAEGGTWYISTPAYCYYNNDNQKGILYNYYALETGKLVPEGWHSATAEEWNYLDSLGRSQLNEAYAKAMCATSGWQASDVVNTPGNSQSTNNAWGLNAKPTGFRDLAGVFSAEGTKEFFWGGLWAVMPSLAVTYNLENNKTTLTLAAAMKPTGASIRCVKNY